MTRKKLIEVALPLEAINEASAREKSIRHGHPSTLHLWWARRPLAACRAVIFASLVDDPGHHPEDHDEPITAPPEFIEACRNLRYKGKNATGVDEKGRSNDTPRMRLFDFIEILVQWESATDERVLDTARELIRLSTGGNPPPLLDPFAGGGSIPLEAQRLGLEAHASDLNPVAVMINKALIEIPPKFANQPPVNPRDREGTAGTGGWKGAAGLAADVRYYGEWMRDQAWERIGHLYPDYSGETVIAWLWARTVKSPNPAIDLHVPLTKRFEVSTKKGNYAWVQPIVDATNKHISFEMRYGKGKTLKGTVDRQGGKCLATGVPIPFDYIRNEAQAGRMRSQLLAIVTEGSGKRNYYGPTIEHEEVANIKAPDGVAFTNLPERALGFRVQRYGMTRHCDLFTPRQITALTTFSDLIQQARKKIYVDAERVGAEDAQAYADSVSVYLAFAVNKGANYWSTLCAWYASKEIMMSTFGRQALTMTWDYAEANPFSDSSGNFLLGIEQAAKSLENAPVDVIGSWAQQQNATSLTSSTGTLLSTDPPYYDNIGYAALSDFFYIWLRRAIGDIYPPLFATMLTPKEPELISEPGRHDSLEKASRFFEEGLFKTFKSIRSIVLEEYPTSIFYAFKEGWTSQDWLR